VIVKKGEHGAMFFSEHETYVLPAYPTERVVDPTGAGDSFTGGMMGYLAEQGNFEPRTLKEAMAYGILTASFTVEDVSLDRPRFPLPREEGERYTRAFLAAVQQGELGALQGLLARDVVLTSDGGGKKLAALHPIVGDDRVARFFAGLAAKADKPRIARLRFLTINGLPGILNEYDDGHLQTTALQIEDGAISAIYVVRNPDKLERLRPLLDEVR